MLLHVTFRIHPLLHPLSLAPSLVPFLPPACYSSLATDDVSENPLQVLCPNGEVRLATDDDTIMHKESGFFFGCATASDRDQDNGSRYIRELCSSLASYAKYVRLEDMTNLTKQRIERMQGEDVDCETTHRLSQDVFFF